MDEFLKKIEEENVRYEKTKARLNRQSDALFILIILLGVASWLI